MTVTAVEGSVNSLSWPEDAGGSGVEGFIANSSHVEMETAVKIVVIIRSWVLRSGKKNS